MVEQWKNKQISPDRDTNEGVTTKEAELLQQGKAKTLVQMWKCMDQENTPPMERRGPRQMTPPMDGERRFSTSTDVCSIDFFMLIRYIVCLYAGRNIITKIQLYG